MENIVKKTMEALEKNNISAYYVEKKEEVVPFVKALIREGDKVAIGGSMTLFETGVVDFLRKGKYTFLDRYAPELTPEDIVRIYRESFEADVYFCSSNAVTENGELYNVDGNANRVAAITHGPTSVILIVGINKIVRDIDQAVLRVKRVAAPLNCKRLSCDTYCAKNGKCIKDDTSFDGCTSPDRICCTRVVTGWQRKPGRIKVVFVGETLGY